ncbi:MAG: hypothetical protein GY747_03970 [Planctomycetes bacterium]|nr:hypothetical protein [Planctomycetota bacterium]MCP4771910.1 hypothetical protein [Planctomycetota bacterium]MCP4859955.1 hypothetical protein [Planctomycetota bacterium]
MPLAVLLLLVAQSTSPPPQEAPGPQDLTDLFEIEEGLKVTLTVNGTVQNSATWAARWSGPIALQSEGAVIEFRNIVLRPILND